MNRYPPYYEDRSERGRTGYDSHCEDSNRSAPSTSYNTYSLPDSRRPRKLSPRHLERKREYWGKDGSSGSRDDFQESCEGFPPYYVDRSERGRTGYDSHCEDTNRSAPFASYDTYPLPDSRRHRKLSPRHLERKREYWGKDGSSGSRRDFQESCERYSPYYVDRSERGRTGYVSHCEDTNRSAPSASYDTYLLPDSRRHRKLSPRHLERKREHWGKDGSSGSRGDFQGSCERFVDFGSIARGDADELSRFSRSVNSQKFVDFESVVRGDAGELSRFSRSESPTKFVNLERIVRGDPDELSRLSRSECLRTFELGQSSESLELEESLKSGNYHEKRRSEGLERLHKSPSRDYRKESSFEGHHPEYRRSSFRDSFGNRSTSSLNPENRIKEKNTRTASLYDNLNVGHYPVRSVVEYSEAYNAETRVNYQKRRDTGKTPETENLFEQIYEVLKNDQRQKKQTTETAEPIDFESLRFSKVPRIEESLCSSRAPRHEETTKENLVEALLKVLTDDESKKQPSAVQDMEISSATPGENFVEPISDGEFISETDTKDQSNESDDDSEIDWGSLENIDVETLCTQLKSRWKLEALSQNMLDSVDIYMARQEKRQIEVEGLVIEAAEECRRYFSLYGEIETFYPSKCSRTNSHFITFKKPWMAKSVVCINKHTVGQSDVTVKLASFLHQPDNPIPLHLRKEIGEAQKRTIIVKPLTIDATVPVLEKMFGEFGEIEFVTIEFLATKASDLDADKYTRRKRCFEATISFAEASEASEALQKRVMWINESYPVIVTRRAENLSNKCVIYRERQKGCVFQWNRALRPLEIPRIQRLLSILPGFKGVTEILVREEPNKPPAIRTALCSTTTDFVKYNFSKLAQQKVIDLSLTPAHFPPALDEIQFSKRTVLKIGCMQKRQFFISCVPMTEDASHIKAKFHQFGVIETLTVLEPSNNDSNRPSTSSAAVLTFGSLVTKLLTALNKKTGCLMDDETYHVELNTLKRHKEIITDFVDADMSRQDSELFVSIRSQKSLEQKVATHNFAAEKGTGSSTFNAY